MKTKGLILFFLATSLININSTFAKAYKELGKRKNSGGKVFELYPVKVSGRKTADCFDDEGRCLLPLTKKPVAKLENFQYHTLNDQIGINFEVDEKTHKSLQDIYKKYQNQRIAIVYEGKVLSAPVLKENIKGNKFNLTFKKAKDFEKILDSLE